MITIQNLSKYYGDTCVLKIDELLISSNEIFGLVGNNGAGKTTLFRCILDLIKPNEGLIEVTGINIGQSEDWKYKVGAYLDEGFLIEFLTAEEYLRFVGKLRGLNDADMDNELEKFKELFNDEILGNKKYIRDLSKGNQKKVGIAAAMIRNPEILILDEPFANLDPTTVFRLKQLIKNYISLNDTTCLISSHDLNHVAELSNRICVLNKGELVKDVATTEKTLEELEKYFAI